MKTINLKAKSWHYFLAVKLGNFNPNSGDFCSYVRNVLFGLVLGSMFAAVVGFLGAIAMGAIVNVSLYLYHWIVGTAYVANAFAQFATIATGVILLAIGFIFGSLVVREKLDDRKMAKAALNEPDSFLKSAYKSFKDKVCFKVNFDNNGDK